MLWTHLLYGLVGRAARKALFVNICPTLKKGECDDGDTVGRGLAAVPLRASRLLPPASGSVKSRQDLVTDITFLS